MPGKIFQAFANRSRALLAPASAAVPTTASTSTSPFGYSQSQADAIVTNLNAVIADEANTKAALNQLIDELVARGLI